MRLACIVLAVVSVSGAGACSDSTAPEPIAPGQFVSVTAGRRHACAIDTIGRAWCWGANGNGQTGTGIGSCTGTCASRPALVSTTVRFASISAGGNHTCAVAVSGVVYCWGNNYYGESGVDGGEACGPSVCIGTPTVAASAFTFTSVVAGTLSTCGVTTGNVGKCWGKEPDAASLTPTYKPHTLMIAATRDSLWASVSRASISVHNCGITLAGPAACWGVNAYGVLAVSDPTAMPPTIAAEGSGLRSIEVADTFACGLGADDLAYCWGQSFNGTLGIGTIPAADPCTARWSIPCTATPTKVIGGLRFSMLTAGESHACGLGVDSRKAWCWGQSTTGEAGTSRFIVPFPVQAAEDIEFSSLAAGDDFTCGVALDRNVYCWGDNSGEQLGRPLVIWSAIPVRVIVDK